ncbi:MAG: hypothetical protein GXX96_27590 [Planctomycetaceae bacterium]|nr:hypothetical protein [Planctomycetaceae bacterium]
MHHHALRNVLTSILITCVLGSLSVSTGHAADQPAGLRAGAAAVDVTPKEFPLNMPGGFSENMAQSAHDPLHARALVLDDGTTTLAMVVVDSLGVSPELIEEVKKLASEETGIATDKMLICSTHSHSCPQSNTTKGPAPEVAYRQVLLAGMVKSIVEAKAALRPAAVGAAAHPLPEEVFNRRWYLKPGKMPLNPYGKMDQVKMNPGTSPDVLDRPAGPTDPDVTILSVQDAHRKPLALWANYSLHYVGAPPRGQVSADYFGEFARLMPSRLRAGEEFVAMMTNGTSGDINNIPFLVTRPPREPFEQIRIVAGKAADAAWFAHRKIEQHRSDVTLGMLQREVVLKYRRPTDEQLAEAKKVLAVTDEKEIEKLPRLAQHYARSMVRAAEREAKTLAVKVQAIRIGDLAICTIPFEVFAEIGLELKDRSPFPQTMVISQANGRYGYLPTPRQHELGGYETWLGTNQVEEQTSVILTNNLLEMLAELK